MEWSINSCAAKLWYKAHTSPLNIGHLEKKPNYTHKMHVANFAREILQSSLPRNKQTVAMKSTDYYFLKNPNNQKRSLTWVHWNYTVQTKWLMIGGIV